MLTFLQCIHANKLLIVLKNRRQQSFQTKNTKFRSRLVLRTTSVSLVSLKFFFVVMFFGLRISGGQSHVVLEPLSLL